jgi:hypothetical protein
MEMKIYLKWWEVGFVLLFISFPLFGIVSTLNDTNNKYGKEKKYFDELTIFIESEVERSSDKDISSDLNSPIELIRTHNNSLYLDIKILAVKMHSLAILIILGIALWINQHRKYEQKITQLEWSLREEKEKSKEG